MLQCYKRISENNFTTVNTSEVQCKNVVKTGKYQNFPSFSFIADNVSTREIFESSFSLSVQSSQVEFSVSTNLCRKNIELQHFYNTSPSTGIMGQELTENIPLPSTPSLEYGARNSTEFSKITCHQLPTFPGCLLESSKHSSNPNDEYKPYFILESEEEKLSYEYFKLLARVTYDEVVEKHREQALEEFHQYRLNLLLEDLRLIEETNILYSSSDESFSEFKIHLPERRRTIQMKNRRKRFQKQKIRK